MEFSKDAKIELAVSKDQLRPALNHVQFTGRHLVATDEHIMAWIPVKADEEDTPGLIQPEVFKEARKASKTLVDCVMFANGSIRLTNGTQIPRTTEDAQYPKVSKVIPRHNKGQKLHINPALLLKLADSLGADSVELVLPEGEYAKRGIMVHPVSKNGHRIEGMGVIMPISPLKD